VAWGVVVGGAKGEKGAAQSHAPGPVQEKMSRYRYQSNICIGRLGSRDAEDAPSVEIRHRDVTRTAVNVNDQPC